MNGLWRRSYVEVVADGHAAWCAGRFLEAGQWYWLAAFVGPTEADSAEMLEASWIATERAQGRRSELEKR